MSDKNIDIELLKKVVKILKENNLNEIEYKTEDITIKVLAGAVSESSASQSSKTNNVVSNNVSPSPSLSHSPENDLSKHPGAVTSLMVGTCYLSPEPGAPNFVSVGDIVKKDQPLMIIEAMKVMNYIKAPKEGKIIHIAVQDSQPIEYGQLLLVIE